MLRITENNFTDCRAICEADNEPLLHEYPQYFFFHPPSLRYTVTFNVETVTRSFLVTSGLHFNCGLVDANNDRNILSSRDITLYVQEGKYTFFLMIIMFNPQPTETIQLKHTLSLLKIINNTIINVPGDEDEKGGSLEPDILSIDCITSQGDHQPFWTTSNHLVGGNQTIIPSLGPDNRTERVSAYEARLTLAPSLPEYEGVYTCRSELSNNFVQISIKSSKYSVLLLYK